MYYLGVFAGFALLSSVAVGFSLLIQPGKNSGLEAFAFFAFMYLTLLFARFMRRRAGMRKA